MSRLFDLHQTWQKRGRCIFLSFSWVDHLIINMLENPHNPPGSASALTQTHQQQSAVSGKEVWLIFTLLWLAHHNHAWLKFIITEYRQIIMMDAAWLEYLLCVYGNCRLETIYIILWWSQPVSQLFTLIMHTKLNEWCWSGGFWRNHAWRNEFSSRAQLLDLYATFTFFKFIFLSLLSIS